MIFDHLQHINLTSDQRIALIEMEQFLVGDENVFMLKGYAGTGKTTLLNGITRFLSSEKSDFRLMAPTGRAAMILSSKTGVKSSTIHRGIYNMDQLLEKKDGTSFKFYYGLKLNQESTQCVYFIDEASMVSDVYSDDEFFTFGSGCLLKDLINYVFMGSNKRKIIFVGDEAQLPPVNMNFSPALDSDYLFRNYNFKSSEVTLSQVVRQDKESGILESATKIRNSISSNVFNAFEINYQNEDIRKVSPEGFIEHYEDVAKAGGVQQAIVITHSNRQALDYNIQIRERRYGDSQTELQNEDWLIITRNNYNGPVELFNGMFAKVLEVGGISYHAEPRFIIEGGKTIQRQLVFRDVLVEVTGINGEKHQLKTTLLNNFLKTEEGRLHPFDQRALYIDFKERMRKRGINPGTDSYREALKSDLYFNALQAKYGYAITCHKSQGGEWENVFVDFKVYMGKFTQSFFRWAYTAITRSNKQLLCIDAPQYNALSQFVVKDIERISNVMAGSVYTPKTENGINSFIQYRKDKLEKICADQQIKVNFKDFNNQLEVSFQQNDKSGKVQLWFSATNFTKTTWQVFNDQEFRILTETILIDSLLPEEIPFEPKFDFQKDLHQYFLDIIADENIPLMNILQNQWNDQYFLHTGATCAMVEFVFNSNQLYTVAKPRSTSGNEDIKLQSIVNKLRGI